MIGVICQNFREGQLGLTRKQFSQKTGLTVSQIRHFEQGRSRNMNILMKYVLLGLDIEEALAVAEEDFNDFIRRYKHD